MDLANQMSILRQKEGLYTVSGFRNGRSTAGRPLRESQGRTIASWKFCSRGVASFRPTPQPPVGRLLHPALFSVVQPRTSPLRLDLRLPILSQERFVIKTGSNFFTPNRWGQVRDIPGFQTTFL